MTKQEDLIEKTVRSIISKFGEGSACTLTKAFAPEHVRSFIPTHNLAVDWVIGRPGFPIGRVSEIAGPYSSGKSSIIAQAIGAAQASGMIAMLLDTEHSYDSSWSRRFGVDPEKLILLQPEHLQGVFDRLIYAIEFVRKEQSDIPIFIAVDSVSATPTAEELDEEDSTSGKQRAAHAKIISEGLRKIGNLIWDQNVALVFVSQLKDNPGIMYGANKSKIGGHAIEFHAGLMLEVRRQSFIKEDDGRVVGQTIQVKSIKNKFVPPFRECTFDLYFEEGIRPREILIDFLSEPLFGLNQIKKGGGWYEFQGSKYRKEDLAEKMDEGITDGIYKALNLTTPFGREEVPLIPVKKNGQEVGHVEKLEVKGGRVEATLAIDNVEVFKQLKQEVITETNVSLVEGTHVQAMSVKDPPITPRPETSPPPQGLKVLSVKDLL